MEEIWSKLKCPSCEGNLDISVYMPTGEITIQCKRCRARYYERLEKERQKKIKNKSSSV